MSRGSQFYHERNPGGERLSRADHWRRSALISGPALLWLFMFLLVPMIMIVAISFMARGDYGELKGPATLENYSRLVGFGTFGFDPLYPVILLRSLLLGAATAAACLAAALPLAFFIASLPNRWKTGALLIVVIPFWTNLLIRTYAWQILFAPDGWLARAARAIGAVEPGEGLYPSLAAVLVGMVCDFLPFMVLPVYASVEKMDWSLPEAARDLGAGRWQVFRHAMLPQISPGLAAGCVLVFLPATGQFVIPDLLGGAKTMMLGNLVQQQFGPSRDWPFGAAIAAVALVLVVASVWFYTRRASERRANLL